jgi:hypothetical protein
MTNNEFIKSIKEEIFNELFNGYFHTMETTNSNTVSDFYWKKILALYDTLDIEGKENLKIFVRLIMTDLLSSVFAKLDGVSSFKYQTELFELKSGNEIINGDLQEIFLMDIEEEDAKNMIL